jgi:hypothetical protein
VPLTCADGGQQPIVGYNYDQTCATDTDCVGIAEGNACSVLSSCTSAINIRALARYKTDTAGTPCYGYGATDCMVTELACCLAGLCSVSGDCYRPPNDSRCLAAGGVCTESSVDCSPGPSNSCPNGTGFCCLQ